MGLELRPYQAETLDALRKGFASGKRAQILYAPTGAGKTEMAIALLEAVRAKGNKAAMVLDRIVLCDQTSQRLDKYNIDHGVMQSTHWRYRPYERIQVCSAQTLEKRGDFPGLNLLIVDECHQTREQTVEFIKKNPNVKVIGLTATPFTKGLGKIYDNVISTVTTKDLVDKQVLVPLKVFVAKEIDMTGAKKVAGEWSQAEASERGIKITGDVVAEWESKTMEIFGRPRKTIVFCSGVAHGASLSKKFAEAGYNFVALSYRDDEQFKKDVIAEFSKPDTDIHGLIATDILTKGFDVPDVMIGVSARPFSKSLSSHIQQMGRVMRANMDNPEDKLFAVWLCLAKGSRVLTNKGLVAIDKVTLDHKIWDGTNFVKHGGAVCNGIQETITYQGLTATEKHLVHTAEGWRTFGDCAREQIQITQTGFGEYAIRLGENIRSPSFLVGCKAKKIYSCFVRMFAMWIQKFNFFVEFAIWKNQRLSSLQPAGANLSNVALQPRSSYASKMLQLIKRTIPSLWRKRGRVQVFWGQRMHSLDNAEFGFAGVCNNSGTLSHTDRQDKSAWALRSWKFALAFSGIEPAKQAGQSIGGTNAQVPNKAPRNSLFRQHIETFLLGWNDSRTNRGEVQQTIIKTKREVWDILDAGSHNRFTCEGLLVHNCHSGNYLRFRGEWDDVFDNGVDELDDGKEKPKKEPTEREKEEAKCPKCKSLWPRGLDICSHCGHVRERKNTVTSVAGVMQELTRGTQSLPNKQEWWSQLNWYVQHAGWSPGRAAHTYKDKFGVWPRGLTQSTMTPRPEVIKFIDSRVKAYIRQMKRR